MYKTLVFVYEIMNNTKWHHRHFRIDILIINYPLTSIDKSL